jgi:outer membrane protein assembly factor BamA
VVVQTITISGNKRTKERIIRRELAIQVGDTILKSELATKIEIDRRKVSNTNLFLTVEFKTTVDSVKNTIQNIDIQIVIKERWYLLAYPTLGLADRNFNEWWYDRGHDLGRLIYGVDAVQYNLTGNNDRLRVRANFGFIPRTDIYYSTPYIDKAQKTGLLIGFSRIVNRTLAYRTNNDKLQFFNSEIRTRERFVPFVSLSRRQQFYGYHSLDFRYSFMHVADTITKLNDNYLTKNQANQNFAQLTYGYLYDNRDNVQYALKGKVWAVQLSRSGLFGNDNVNLWETNLDWLQFIPISKKLFFSYAAEVKATLPTDQPFSMTRGLGYGSDLVRGYELYVIDGQHYGYLKTNLRYKLFDKIFHLKFLKISQFNTVPVTIYPNIYADIGYVVNNFANLNNSRLANRPLMGVGLGLDVVTWYNVVARLNYSGNQLGEWRPYFSIGREF